ncbi:MAG: hypothetical protein O3A46_12055 [Candidatus Poribacteria bacterium]|nr:hypothetical protein [Candidatus Poribacteria bacterium]
MNERGVCYLVRRNIYGEAMIELSLAIVIPIILLLHSFVAVSFLVRSVMGSRYQPFVGICAGVVLATIILVIAGVEPNAPNDIDSLFRDRDIWEEEFATSVCFGLLIGIPAGFVLPLLIDHMRHPVAYGIANLVLITFSLTGLYLFLFGEDYGWFYSFYGLGSIFACLLYEIIGKRLVDEISKTQSKSDS